MKTKWIDYIPHEYTEDGDVDDSDTCYNWQHAYRIVKDWDKSYDDKKGYGVSKEWTDKNGNMIPITWIEKQIYDESWDYPIRLGGSVESSKVVWK
jgi:hypothetical protein